MSKKNNDLKLLDLIPNDKHKKFILSYIESGNATKAYLEAYPSVSYKTAKTNAARLLANANLSAALKNIFEELWDNRKGEIGKLFKNLIAIANTDIDEIVEFEKGQMKIRDFSKVDTRAIQTVKHTVKETKYGTDVVTEVKLVDKVKAMELAARILRMIDNTTELTGTVTIKKAVRPERKRNQSKSIKKQEV